MNIFATRAEDADNETYKKLVEIFQTDPEVQKGLIERRAAPPFPCRSPAKELQASLAKVEADTKAHKADAGLSAESDVSTRHPIPRVLKEHPWLS